VDDLVAEGVDVGDLVAVAVRHVEARAAHQVEDVLPGFLRGGFCQYFLDRVQEHVHIGDQITVFAGDVESYGLHNLAQMFEVLGQFCLSGSVLGVVDLEILRNGRCDVRTDGFG